MKKIQSMSWDGGEERAQALLTACLQMIRLNPVWNSLATDMIKFVSSAESNESGAAAGRIMSTLLFWADGKRLRLECNTWGSIAVSVLTDRTQAWVMLRRRPTGEYNIQVEFPEGSVNRAFRILLLIGAPTFSIEFACWAVDGERIPDQEVLDALLLYPRQS